MRLFSYIVVQDTGFSPNPFWGYCTLANCKPAIRRTAKKGDWIVGLSPKSKGNKIIYVMEVQKILTYADYFYAKRFQNKKPDYTKNKIIPKCGDNIYEPLLNGEFRQLPSMHYNHKEQKEDLSKKELDLGGKNVLISKNYFYFGSDAIGLPNEFAKFKTGKGFKNSFSEELIVKFINFISNNKKGIHASPAKWPGNDKSWKTACR